MIHNKKILIKLFIFTSLISSCNKSEKEYYKDGTLKAKHYINNTKKDSSIFYYRDGEIESSIIYLNNKKSVINYYENGNIKSQGNFINDTMPTGNWLYFYNDGKLKEVKEFLIIDSKPLLNQNWFFNHKGDTVKSKSSYFDLLVEKDTIYLNEPVKAKIDLVSPFFKDKNSSIMVVLTKDYSDDFNSDFSNLNNVDLDTTYNLNLEVDFKNALNLKTDFRKTSVFGRYFDTIGMNKLKGVLIEYYYTDTISSPPINYYEIKKYFEKPIYVKDTITPDSSDL